MGGFCLLVELHGEGSASAACAAGLFEEILSPLYVSRLELVKASEREREREREREGVY